MPPPPPANRTIKSNLTVALEQAKADGRLKSANLFADYSVHDARPPVLSSTAFGRSDPRSRRFSVWIWKVHGLPRVRVDVQPRLGTTVREFAGLTLWQFFNEMSTEPVASSLRDLDVDYFEG